MQATDLKSSLNKYKESALIDNLKYALFNYKISIKSNKKPKTSKDCPYKTKKITYFTEYNSENTDKLRDYTIYRMNICR
jgi:hypothetical protein